MIKVKNGHADDYVYVGGNTKYLRDFSQEELKVLEKNGDVRVSREAAATPAVEPAKEKK